LRGKGDPPSLKLWRTKKVKSESKNFEAVVVFENISVWLIKMIGASGNSSGGFFDRVHIIRSGRTEKHRSF